MLQGKMESEISNLFLVYLKKRKKQAKVMLPPPSIRVEERDEMYQQIEDMKGQLREKNMQIKALQSEIDKLISERKQ